jgi:radial spoke head protein 4/6
LQNVILIELIKLEVIYKIMELNNSKEVFEILSKIQLTQNKEYTLYSHLQNLYTVKMQLSDDETFLDLFEDISMRIKTEGKYLPSDNIDKNVFKYLEEFCKNVGKKKSLLNPLIKPDSDEPVGQIGNVPDYYSVFQSLEWVGLSFGNNMAYLLTCSLKNLVFKKELVSVRFWGKIYGSKQDYFIAESPAKEGTILYNIRRWKCRRTRKRNGSSRNRFKQIYLLCN